MGGQPQFENDELEALTTLQESVSALCCATAFVLQADGAWDHFREWLLNNVMDAGDDGLHTLLSMGITPESMAQSLREADRLLMIAEGIQMSSAEDFLPVWLKAAMSVTCVVCGKHAPEDEMSPIPGDAWVCRTPHDEETLPPPDVE